MIGQTRIQRERERERERERKREKEREGISSCLDKMEEEKERKYPEIVGKTFNIYSYV